MSYRIESKNFFEKKHHATLFGLKIRTRKRLLKLLYSATYTVHLQVVNLIFRQHLRHYSEIQENV